MKKINMKIINSILFTKCTIFLVVWLTIFEISEMQQNIFLSKYLILGMLDENGRIIEEGPEPKPQLKGESRTFRVLLDPNQYHQDMERAAAGGQDTYDSFNILMR